MVIVVVPGSDVGPWAGIVGAKEDAMDNGIPCMVEVERWVARMGGNAPEDLKDGVDMVVVDVVVMIVMAEPPDEVARLEVKAE